MYLDPFARDFESFLKDFAAALDAPETYIYLDTSVLMWLVRLGTEARTEFLDWCKARPTGTVRIPVWAAHEFHKHLTRGTIQKNIRVTLGTTQAKFDEFLRLANERADGAASIAKGYLGRDGFVSEVEASWAKLAVLATAIEMDDASHEKAATEVIDFVNARVLKSDLDAIVMKVNAVGLFRADHEIPPGFHDGHKDANRFGDVLMWEEIVTDVSKSATSKLDAIFVSRDEKTDWISAAPMIYGSRGELTKPNRDRGFDVALARPLLVHEFSMRTNETGTKLFIANPGMLASAIHYGVGKKGGATQIKNWLSCSFRPDHVRLGLPVAGLATTATPAANAQTQQSPNQTGMAQPNASTTQSGGQVVPNPEAGFLTNLSIKEVMAPAVRSELSEFRSANPLTQTQLIQQWLHPPNRLATEKLGRLLAELVRNAAPGVAEQLIAIIESTRTTMTQDQHGRLVLGVIASGYFDSDGELLRRPYAPLAGAAINVAKRAIAPDALVALGRFLFEKKAELPYIPGSRVTEVQWMIDSAQATSKQPAMLRELRVGGYPIMVDQIPTGPHRLTSLLGKAPAKGCSGLDLRTLVSARYMIPLDLLLPAQWDKQKYSWPADAGLVMMDTESEGGFRPLADPVEEN